MRETIHGSSIEKERKYTHKLLSMKLENHYGILKKKSCFILLPFSSSKVVYTRFFKSRFYGKPFGLRQGERSRTLGRKNLIGLWKIHVTKVSRDARTVMGRESGILGKKLKV